ncbi:hypothetical protein [Rubeoparvulum massiliense]|uniref:hypothetical protein n=1 Tax=Rubeoparvulum massiliense TaxID=1631346 RepID=UPI00065E4A35|nr:hypothetical protein [Rubeoparvulum massiliense]
MKAMNKAVLLIVEGPCEEVLLIDRLRELFENHKIRFYIQGGDMFSDFRNRQRSIKAIVGETVKKYMNKYKFKPEDILAVLQIIDTDGCFIPEGNIKIDVNQGTKTLYCQDNICVIDEEQKRRIIERNEQKSRNVKIMKTSSKILENKIDYRIYYFSRNLEHALFNEPNPNEETKISDVERFLDDLEVPVEDFLREYIPSSSSDDYGVKYLESWQQVEQGLASLHRYTNVPLLFEFIQLSSSTIES